MNALHLMQRQLPVLFDVDADGRLRTVAEPGYLAGERDPAPRFFMGRTSEGNVWRVRHDVPDDLVRTLDELCLAEPATSDFTRTPVRATAVRAVLSSHAPVTAEERGPAYWIPEDPPLLGEAVLVNDDNAHLLEAHFPRRRHSRAGFRFGPVVAALEGGVAVSLCYCARFAPDAAEAGVETVEAARGRGNASAAVALWARAVREGGRTPLYSTSWSNVASQGVARKVGAAMYGEDWWID
ncbi:GNAT family N-acetyltransferase [Deinococcus yavapaiensis]|uniref:GNAT acetyltransferase-like protein n=1 Tax=Deinococcus yavapaiensis KR-236 TaxID=694435 RepID=A0A318SDK7_9DEIO|nr:GNAT family N-acetyltransferase [Deinococcus yavapaiensis]PYE55464.1 hypothetical protein DES52_103297 [Deinococcus yavapaiensis KR-236]